jgi:hypothetical protein
MITGLTGENLPQWIDTARTAGLPSISSFAKGLRSVRDFARKEWPLRGSPADVLM